MRVFLLILVALLVIGCLGDSTPRLFVNPRPSLRKLQAFKRVYSTGLRLGGDDETRFDEKLAVVLKESPLLSLQNALAIVFTVNFLAELLSLIPMQFQNNVRAQGCWLVVAIKLIDLFWSVDLADFSVRDNYESNEVAGFAQVEVQPLVKNVCSKSLAFAMICLVSGCPARCLLPLMITEIPTILRVLGIAWTIAFPILEGGVEQRNALIHGLFDVSNDNFPANSEPSAVKGNTDTLDGACDFAGDISLLYGALSMAYNLVRSPAVGHPVRGVADMIIFSVKLLLVLQFLSLQLQYLTSGQSIQGIAMWISNGQMGRLILSHPVLVELYASMLQVCTLLKKLLTSEDKLRTVRELLGRHNVEVMDTRVVDGETEAREKAVRDLNKNGEYEVVNGVARRAVKKQSSTATTARKDAQVKRKKKKDSVGKSSSDKITANVDKHGS